MHFVGLLTHRQKQAGYFIMQDDPEDPDFAFLFHRRNGDNPECIKTWLYADLTIKAVRDAAKTDMEEVRND